MNPNLRRLFFSPHFAIGVLLSLSSLVIHTIPEMKVNWEVYRAKEYYASALQLTIQPIYFGGFILFAVLSSAFPASSSLIDDQRERMSVYEAGRLGLKRYIRTKAFSASLCGGVATATGFLLHAMFCYALFLPSDPLNYPAHVLPYDGTLYAGIYGLLGGWPMVAYVALMLGMTGFVWALIGLATAAWIPDKVIAAAAPVMVYYLWLWGGFRDMLGGTGLSPTTLYNDGLTWAKLAASLAQYLILGVLAWLLFRRGMHRRLANG